MRLIQNQKYRAELSLPFFATLNMAKTRLEEAGFADVTVYKSGGKTYAQGTWPGLSQDVELPSQVVRVAVVT